MPDTKPTIIIVPEAKGQHVLSKLPGVEVVLVAPDRPIPEQAKGATILVVGPAEQQSEVDAALIQIGQLPNLKLLQTLGQGVEQWDGVLPDGLQVSTARGAHGGSTAELAVTMLLALTRDVPHYVKNQQAHTWEGRRAKTLMGSQILVYGAGDLGENIRSRLQPFGAAVTVVASHARGDIVDMQTAQSMLSKTDAIIMALPLTPETEHTVDAEFLSALPDGATVVNAGRGGLVDQAALLAELQNGRLRAALDVMTPEPLPADDPLWDAPNVLVTPHVGGNTDGADDRAWSVASDQIKHFIQNN